MLFGNDEDLQLQPKRTKTVLISLGIHLALIVFLIFNPDLLTSPPKRIIKVMGQDYDLSKEELTELVEPPKPAPPDKPLVQPPAPKPAPQPEQQQTPPPQPQPQAAPPPPPPPPPPPKPQPPPPVIGPDDVIKEGARPDAPPNRSSRGNTTEQARNGSQDQQPKPEQQAKPGQQAQIEKQLPPIALNRNPNVLQAPGGNIMDSARRTVDQQIEQERRRGSVQGPRTGTAQGQEDPNFSTEEPTILSDTRGYDFGPYMNGVVNRVRNNWYALIPEIARLGRTGKVVIIFTITKNGNIANLRQAANSGTEALDRAAYGSITASNPFSQLPAGFDGDHLDLQFTFLYNIR
ncbi:MAG TPA: TonB family protein [Terriglobia bacterium]|jgi:TonB family protein